MEVRGIVYPIGPQDRLLSRYLAVATFHIVEMLYDTPFLDVPQNDLAVLKRERNAEIVARYQAGETDAEIARVFGVSEHRVSQIPRGRRSQARFFRSKCGRHNPFGLPPVNRTSCQRWLKLLSCSCQRWQTIFLKGFIGNGNHQRSSAARRRFNTDSLSST